ncbi:serine/threonine protein kinase, partial [Mycobacterium tuberculosis]|nr:serine/threonine protein kinase [Mycobacterium tuberculosis]
LYSDFYSGLFASNFQPQEGGAEDRTDGEFAQLAKTVGAGAAVITCIKSGDALGTAKTKAANGYSTLSGVNANSTPFVWD